MPRPVTSLALTSNQAAGALNEGILMAISNSEELAAKPIPPGKLRVAIAPLGDSAALNALAGRSPRNSWAARFSAAPARAAS
ncbi:MAG: hypothetical protein ACRDFS_09610 [Chloroflexota bacterium]